LSFDKLALISLVFIVGALGLWVPRRYEWDWIEEKILWLDITVV
jgi:hypothetical protein